MSPLLNHEKRSLLTIARNSIAFVLMGGIRPEIQAAGNLAIPAGAFVSLHNRGRLRGCIGRIASVDPLATVVAECAVSAATADPRFLPLRAAELDALQIEISVLSVPWPGSAAEIEPGIHGAIISHGTQRGILLPQVAARYHWSREYFLEQTCCKAGLDAGAWKDSETLVELFTAEIFCDSAFRTSEEKGSETGNAKTGAGSYSSSQ